MALSSKMSLHRLRSPKERMASLVAQGWISADAVEALSEVTDDGWSAMFDASVENVVAAYPMPLSAATGFVVNGREVLAPMVTEERTVVAAASKAAKLCRPEGFSVEVAPPIAVAQLLYPRPEDPERALAAVRDSAAAVIEALRKADRMTARGGGPQAMGARIMDSERGPLLVVEVRIDVRDAMGANAATETGHRAAALLAGAVSDKPLAVICGNDVPERMAVARAVWRAETLGADLAKDRDVRTDRKSLCALGYSGMNGVFDLEAWAASDPTRAVTHMKGVMNGITAVALATGQDTRALEAAVWAEACRGGACRPLTTFRPLSSGDLCGEMRIPIVAGTVGGGTGHPMAKLARALAGVTDAKGLIETMAAVGLAQNFAALWSLAHEGIIAAHKRLGRR
jgi:hydroxymethylglutaryl-CoA reductase